MPGIVEWPTVVQLGVDQFGSLFENECQRRRLASGRGFDEILRARRDRHRRTEDSRHVYLGQFLHHARTMNHVHRKQDSQGHSRAYVGDLKRNRKVLWKGVEQKISDVAASIPSEDRKEIRRGDTRQWYFTATFKIPKVNHKVGNESNELGSEANPVGVP